MLYSFLELFTTCRYTVCNQWSVSYCSVWLHFKDSRAKMSDLNIPQSSLCLPSTPTGVLFNQSLYELSAQPVQYATRQSSCKWPFWGISLGTTELLKATMASVGLFVVTTCVQAHWNSMRWSEWNVRDSVCATLSLRNYIYISQNLFSNFVVMVKVTAGLCLCSKAALF